MTNDFELDNMRLQMATLKQKLDKQQIVNDRLIRASMNHNVSEITQRYYALMVLGVVMIPFGYWVFVMLSHFSIGFWIATCIYMMICSAATFYNGKDLIDKKLMANDLVEVRTKVVRAKKLDSRWLAYGVPMAAAWMVWFFYECYKQNETNFFVALAIGGAVGATIGMVIGLSVHFKTQRQYQEIIDQIEELRDSR